MSFDRDDVADVFAGATAATQTQQPQSQQPARINFGAGFGGLSLGMNASGGGNAATISAFLETAKKPLEEVRTKMADWFDIHLFPVLASDAGNQEGYDSVAIVAVVKNEPNVGFLHCVAMEPEEKYQIKPRRTTVPDGTGSSKEINTVPFVGRVLEGNDYVSNVANYLNRTRFGMGMKWVDGPASVAIAYNTLDVTLEDSVRRVLFASMNAILIRAYGVAGVPDISVTSLIEEFKNNSMVVCFDPHARDLVGAEGTPIFSQARVAVVTPSANNNRGGYNNGGHNVVTAALQSTFVYSPQQVPPTYPGEVKKITYDQLLSVVDFDTGTVPTLGRILLTMAAVYGTMQNNVERARAIHRPLASAPQEDPWYIGALEMEANLMGLEVPQQVSLEGGVAGIGASSFQNYMRTVVSDTLFFALDAVPYTSMGIFLLDFVKALFVGSTGKDENELGARAHLAIWNAANQLTEGRLSKLYPADRRIVTSVLPFAAGYFHRNGRTLPLTAIDTLYVANHYFRANEVQAGQGVMAAWGDTWMSNRLTSHEKLLKQRDIIDTITSGSSHVTGQGMRLILDAEFLKALLVALTTKNHSDPNDKTQTLSLSYEAGNVEMNEPRVTATSALSGGSRMTSTGYAGGNGGYNSSYSSLVRGL